MGNSNMRFILISSFYISLHFLCLIRVSVSQDVCATVDCGQGKCVVDMSSILGYNCQCEGGWKQFQLGPFTFPPCVVPNCTITNDCGSGAPPAPPPPFELPPATNLTDPCNLVWCNDGSCVANGTGHYCQCNEGSTNLLNSTTMPCYKPCAIGADCSGLGLISYLTPPPPLATNGTLILAPPPPPPQPPPPLISTTNGTSSPPLTTPQPPLPNGSNNTSKCSRRYALNMSLLAVIILAVVPSIVS